MLRWKASLKPTDGGGSAPVYDAYADGGVNNGSSIPSFNINIGSGGNAAVIVSVRSESGGSGVTPAADITVTVGGTSATLISGATGTGFVSHHLFGIAMGSATGNQAVVVSWTSGNAYNHAVASSFTGVDQTTPFDNGTGHAVAYAATSDTLAITSATGDLTFSDFGEKGGAYETVTVNNTQRYNLLGADGRAVGSTAAGAASVNHTATITTYSGGAAHVGCNLNAVSGGGGVPTPDLLHWPLNDAAGATIAASVGPGSTTSTGTLNGDYLYMDSGNAAFESSSTLTYGTNVVSVSFWWQTDNTGMFGEVFRSEIYTNTNMFEFYNGGGWKTLRVKGDSGILEERVYDLLSANTWYHFVCVFDGSTATGDAKFYINKVAQTLSNNSNNKTGTSNFSTAEFCMKGPYGTAADFLMDDLRIYSGELTTSQIDAIYDAGRPS